MTVFSLYQNKILAFMYGFSIPFDKSRTELNEAGLLRLDIPKAFHKLGWHPVMDVDQMIQIALHEYKIGDLSGDAIFYQRYTHIHKYMNLQKKV